MKKSSTPVVALPAMNIELRKVRIHLGTVAFEAEKYMNDSWDEMVTDLQKEHSGTYKLSPAECEEVNRAIKTLATLGVKIAIRNEKGAMKQTYTAWLTQLINVITEEDFDIDDISLNEDECRKAYVDGITPEHLYHNVCGKDAGNFYAIRT